MTWLVIIVFCVLAFAGMPLAFALGFASLAALYAADFELVMMAQRMLHAVDNFPLMAIPLFMLAGELMVKAGMMERLVAFANSLVGRVHGGLAHVTIIAGTILASVSGAAVASASALGSALVPALRKHYPDSFNCAVIASAANLGPVIPPSNAMIVYALMAGSSVSVGGLFMAGIVPGVLLALGFIGIASFVSWRRKYPPTGEAFNARNAWVQFRKAHIILFMPIIVVGGIIGGVFTATEGAAIAVVYSGVVGLLVTRKLRLSDLPGCLFRAAVTASMVGALIALAATVTFLLTVDMVPQQMADWVKSMTADPMVFVLLTMLLLVVVGMFMESNAAYIMLVPLFVPIADAFGLDPLWFGFLFMFNLVIGMMTPPVGVLFFVMSGITRVPMGAIIRESMPFVIFQFVMLLLCVAFPSIVTALPRALGF
ncbi:MAG: TRAP transporter large permease [Comamonadaceae bacterium]|jgi:tripartite ATP-independent transporter DctM subunit|uniref:TRAP transporter large permease protein n=1 Tax=Hydrogenophaga borbori TaxID=2294117 RepID=A0A372EJV2_9BURK|nr:MULTISPECIES: TRAP transporter large permease [Hydrogenophaga]NCT98139.1 TRAP transporter large permease [Comamonadaceae bacterium]RFP78818.1 TRAP transporter large permease [Hydrogenophaga borbori]WQB83756.1 TRAP transporter large permease [Hydrogenophaga sp. SNF1]